MTINRNDDYEKLARILYPSIEASGNVYYGQTRKLTLDEVLKTNDLGFESHIEEFEGESLFCWKLGPLKKSALYCSRLFDLYTVSIFYHRDIEIINLYDGEPNYILRYNFDDPLPRPYTIDSTTGKWVVYDRELRGTLFAKYKLKYNNKQIDTNLYSGKYSTYEVDLDCSFECYCFTSGFDPTNKSNGDIGDRRFFIDDNNEYLYIKLNHYYTSSNSELEYEEESEEEYEDDDDYDMNHDVYYQLPMYNPLTFTTGPGGTAIKIAHRYIDAEPNDTPIIIYKKSNSDTWEEVRFNDLTPSVGALDELWIESDEIVLPPNISIQFACVYSLQGTFNRFKFTQMTGHPDECMITASGDAMSMAPLFYYPDELPPGGLSDLVSYSHEMATAIGLHDAYELFAKHSRLESDISYNELSFMFYSCTLLSSAPYIGQWNNYTKIYGLYSYCSSLTSIKPISPMGVLYLSKAFQCCTSLVHCPDIRCFNGDIQVEYGEDEEEDYHNYHITVRTYEDYNGCTSLKSLYLLYRNYILIDLRSDDTKEYSNDIPSWLTSVPEDCIIHIPWVLTKSNIRELNLDGRDDYLVKHVIHPIDACLYTQVNNFSSVIYSAVYDEEDEGLYNTYLKMIGNLHKVNYIVSSGYDNSNVDLNRISWDRYNYDGSYNQRVYGAKSFRGPVEFTHDVSLDIDSLTCDIKQISAPYNRLGNQVSVGDVTFLKITFKEDATETFNFVSMYSVIEPLYSENLEQNTNSLYFTLSSRPSVQFKLSVCNMDGSVIQSGRDNFIGGDGDSSEHAQKFYENERRQDERYIVLTPASSGSSHGLTFMARRLR